MIDKSHIDMRRKEKIMDSEERKRTEGLIDIHTHGGFGVNFNSAKEDEIIFFAGKIRALGVYGFLPTLASDSIKNLKHQILQIKQAADKLPSNCAKILGIHLEACFLNPEKKGIHVNEFLLAPSVENYKLLEDDFIKIVTLAPECDKNFELTNYLRSKGVKVQAGHTKTTDLSAVDGVTHLFNAMDGISHKKASTAVLALNSDRLFTEVIGDSVHICDETLKLIFKAKDNNKIILVSDSLPITHSDVSAMNFCGKEIHLKDNTACGSDGTIAGSTMFLNEIIKNLVSKELISFEAAITMAAKNPRRYLNLPDDDFGVLWDKDLNIIS